MYSRQGDLELFNMTASGSLVSEDRRDFARVVHSNSGVGRYCLGHSIN